VPTELVKFLWERNVVAGFRWHVNTKVKPVFCWNLFSKRNEVVTEEMKAAINAKTDSVRGRNDDNERFKKARTGSHRPC
jgi:hypothetical protein